MNLIYIKHEVGISQLKRFKVVGVNYNNRQSVLEKLYAKQSKGKQISITLDFTTYENEPAIKVLADKCEIGFVAKNDVTKLYDNQANILGIESFRISLNEDYASTSDGEIKVDKNGNPILKSRVYSVKMSIVIRNKTVKPKTLTLHNQSQPNPKRKNGSFGNRTLGSFLN